MSPIRRSLIAVLTLAVAVLSSACASEGFQWTGTWRSQAGLSLSVDADSQSVGISDAQGSTVQGRLRPGAAGAGTVDWVVYPSPETAALGARATLTQSGADGLMLTSGEDGATYPLCIFIPSGVHGSPVQALERALSRDPSIVRVEYVSSAQMLERYKRLTTGWPAGAGLLRGNPLRGSLTAYVSTDESSSVLIPRIATMPETLAMRSGPQPWQRCLIVAGAQKRTSVLFRRTGE